MTTRLSPAFLPLFLLLLVPSLAVTGCERGGIGTPEGEVQDDRDRSKAEEADPGESLEDASVTAKVRTRLARDERSEELDLEAVEVETRGGVVTLRGSVDREGTRTAAEEIARATDGVSDVVNQISVGSGESSAA